MAERTKSIDKAEFSRGHFVMLECMMCGQEKTIAAETQKYLVDAIKEDGWKYLSSDQYGAQGHWCGCDYKD